MTTTGSAETQPFYFDNTGSKGVKFGKEPIYFDMDTTGSKGHKFGYAPGNGKLLVSLEDLTMRRGMEIIQEVYIVVLGFNPYGTGQTKPLITDSDPLLDRLFPDGSDGRNFFYGEVTPIFKMKKNRKHVFPGGLPLFYGFPSSLTSFYMAVMESDRGAREIGKLLADNKKMMKETLDELKVLPQLAQSAKFDLVRASFLAMTQVLQSLLLNNKDDLRYSNVFTFRQEEDYLAGVHENWGDHRVGMTLEVVAPEREWILKEPSTASQ